LNVTNSKELRHLLVTTVQFTNY